MRGRTIVEALSLLTILTVGPALGKIGGTTLEALAEDASSIVIGETTEIVLLDDVPFALVEVKEVIKGPHMQRLLFLARGTWVCDTSTSSVGESALLFLDAHEHALWTSPQDEGPSLPWNFGYEGPEALRYIVLGLLRVGWVFEIAQSGRGRMPIHRESGQDYVTVWVRDVQLPRAVRTTAGPEPRTSDFIRSARLTVLRRYLTVWSYLKAWEYRATAKRLLTRLRAACGLEARRREPSRLPGAPAEVKPSRSALRSASPESELP